MSAKPIVPRASAERNIDDAIDRYLDEAGEDVALAFVDALERTFEHIAHHPATGSPRYRHELDLPGLRSWPLKRHPYLVFYIEREDHVDVWRVLHGERDIPT